MPTVGVLALQGAFAKHIVMVESLNARAKEVRKPEELQGCDALIIPGGESTTMLRQIQFMEFAEPLCAFAKEKPIFGTCAGLILMSSKVINSTFSPFGWIDIEVERNAYGSQIASAEERVSLCLTPPKAQDFPAFFIRAPRIVNHSPSVQVLATHHKEPILVQEGHHLAATFHPELTGNPDIHRYFISLVLNTSNAKNRSKTTQRGNTTNSKEMLCP